ncbi:MAG: hypothetical protein J6J51_00030 [Clostridia bacterium]|nr:hypothetical protein [Clostridia bacterium]
MTGKNTDFSHGGAPFQKLDFIFSIAQRVGLEQRAGGKEREYLQFVRNRNGTFTENSEKTEEKQKKWLTVYILIPYNTWCVIGSGASLKARARAGVNNSFDQEV